jgi:hypothetical protein
MGALFNCTAPSFSALLRHWHLVPVRIVGRTIPKCSLRARLPHLENS